MFENNFLNKAVGINGGNCRQESNSLIMLLRDKTRAKHNNTTLTVYFKKLLNKLDEAGPPRWWGMGMGVWEKKNIVQIRFYGGGEEEVTRQTAEPPLADKFNTRTST